MKKLYDAANALQAKILADYLKQQGIETQIHGADLQGASGELPAAGLVRIMVSERDFEPASAALVQWESTTIEPTPGPTNIKKSSTYLGFATGLLVGAAITLFALKTPTGIDGTDFNRDGVLDERWILSPTGRTLRYELDRNLDGKVDYTMEFDSRALAESGKSDDDFNGVFETTFTVNNANITNTKVDTDGDEFADLSTQYQNGVVTSIEYLNPKNGLVLRVEHFKLGKIVFAEIDTDRDGTLDTRQNFSPLAEIVSTQAIPVK
jgi:hypothetical protein